VFTFTDGWKIVGSNNPTNHTLFKDLFKECGIEKRVASLPALYDNELKKIVVNDSLDIIAFMGQYVNSLDLIPSCDNKEFYENFNQKIAIGTYKAGHAKTQDEYVKYTEDVFAWLDYFDKYLEDRCENGRFFTDPNKLFENLKELNNTNDYCYVFDKLSYVDIVVYCHLIRFDIVFFNLFKTNKKHLWEYTNICRYMKNLSFINAFKNATDVDEIKRGAYLTENNLPQNLGCVKIPLGNGGIEHYF
jgi:putative glutathione S-transferase